MTNDEIVIYLNGLKPGERVMETTFGTCNYKMQGTVYISELDGPSKGCVCVKWDNGMGTSATWGTRRLSDVNVPR